MATTEELIDALYTVPLDQFSDAIRCVFRGDVPISPTEEWRAERIEHALRHFLRDSGGLRLRLANHLGLPLETEKLQRSEETRRWTRENLRWTKVAAIAAIIGAVLALVSIVLNLLQSH